MRSKRRRWIGVDGEGVGRAPHRYVLLACSDGGYIEDRKGLPTVKCLDFLLKLGTRDARVCGYSLSYDWTKIVADMPDAKIHALFRPELRAVGSGRFRRVRFGRYKLHFLAGTMWLKHGKKKVTVWDIFKYFQTSFCKVDEDGDVSGALVDWDVAPDVQLRIAAMKNKRSSFTWKDQKLVREYCLDECRALAELAGKLEQAHLDADLQPRAWFSPGSTASVLLLRHGIDEKRGALPPPMLHPVACAFTGGWAEICRNGVIRGAPYICGYDLSSAYPAQIVKLPCLEHGRWEVVDDERKLRGKNVVHALVRGHIRNVGDVAWAPLPVRLEGNCIVHPRGGASGWWWRDEWLAAREGWNGLEFERAFILKKECDCQPFAFVPDLFKLRVKVGKRSGAGIVIKLVLNSLYGKLSQIIGNPRFASRAWAGMITSGTRAEILRLMLRHERMDSVLMVATDGVYTTERLESDDIVAAGSPDVVLGGWEREEYKKITIVRPGQYWVDDEKVRARGIGRDVFNEAGKQKVLQAFKEGLSEIELESNDKFGNAKQCVYGKTELKRMSVYGEWYRRKQRVSLAPEPKRAADWSPPMLDGVEGLPYDKRAIALSTAYAAIFEQLREHLD